MFSTRWKRYPAPGNPPTYTPAIGSSTTRARRPTGDRSAITATTIASAHMGG
ncbi:hypothetical protein OG589_10925 [Sphaerisporangium sp. NBC_01403]|uniref:hypothetical protein n=1 Tax=Sphaerisporangium sp. NBC_01403 TaxID=2903599 RepID=UPI003247875E